MAATESPVVDVADEKPIEKLTPEVQEKKKQGPIVAEKVTGTVKWFNVRNGYGFINRHDTKEDVFVHQTSIAKNNPKKYLRSVGDDETVEFNVIKGEKGLEAIEVTGPDGEPVQGSKYAPDRRPRYKRRGGYRGRGRGRGRGGYRRNSKDERDETGEDDNSAHSEGDDGTPPRRSERGRGRGRGRGGRRNWYRGDRPRYRPSSVDGPDRQDRYDRDDNQRGDRRDDRRDDRRGDRRDDRRDDRDSGRDGVRRDDEPRMDDRRDGKVRGGDRRDNRQPSNRQPNNRSDDYDGSPQQEGRPVQKRRPRRARQFRNPSGGDNVAKSADGSTQETQE